MIIFICISIISYHHNFDQNLKIKDKLNVDNQEREKSILKTLNFYSIGNRNNTKYFFIINK